MRVPGWLAGVVLAGTVIGSAVALESQAPLPPDNAGSTRSRSESRRV